MVTDLDYRVREAAQGSLVSVRRLLQCFSSSQRVGGGGGEVELGSAAKEAIARFKGLVSLLEASLPSNRKRIRKGPLPSSMGIDVAQMMDSKKNPSKDDILRTTIAGGSPWQREARQPAERKISNTAMWMDSRISFDRTITMPSRTSFVSSLSVEGGGDGGSNSVGNQQLLNYYCYSSSPSVQTSMGVSSSFHAWRRKHEAEDGGARCTVSAGGCHCSKRRKQRIKRTIMVPAVSSKLADIPPDDFSWRKYGQKPIKGSPHPRSYYKCSSMRGCPARKHVERCVEDANMVVVTYEGGHIHPPTTPSIPNFLLTQPTATLMKPGCFSLVKHPPPGPGPAAK